MADRSPHRALIAEGREVGEKIVAGVTKGKRPRKKPAIAPVSFHEKELSVRVATLEVRGSRKAAPQVGVGFDCRSRQAINVLHLEVGDDQKARRVLVGVGRQTAVEDEKVMRLEPAQLAAFSGQGVAIGDALEVGIDMRVNPRET